MKIALFRHQGCRALLLAPIAALGIASIVASGGGGGDDGELEPPDLPPIIPQVLNYLLSPLQNNAPLIVSDGTGLSVSVDFNDIVFGTVNLSTDANNDVTFNSYATRDTTGLEMTVSGSGEPALDGLFEFVVTSSSDPIRTTIGEYPNSGTFEVRRTGETITVEIVSATEVRISLNAGAPISYTWDEFTDLVIDEMLPPWQRRASIAGGVYTVINDLALVTADTLNVLESAAITNPLAETCDLFTGTPPQGVLAQGEETITWLGSGAEIMDGDNFVWNFIDCWDNDPGDPIDILINGTVSLDNYTETIDFFTNTLFEIGFGSLSINGMGGVTFDNFVVSETEESAGTFTINPADDIIVDGGFTLIFQQL